jgi:hypothetical protein
MAIYDASNHLIEKPLNGDISSKSKEREEDVHYLIEKPVK